MSHLQLEPETGHFKHHQQPQSGIKQGEVPSGHLWRDKQSFPATHFSCSRVQQDSNPRVLQGGPNQALADKVLKAGPSNPVPTMVAMCSG
eukprot:GABU01008698.1.p1 GENE.GABU01008698.1~~GABU01008698.1.p1  ORF type:complete len:105 (-),score=5.13 GABU01008698.1:187-456(-)